MSRVGIVAALHAEARAISTRKPRTGIPLTLDNGSLLIVSGIGPAAAAAAAMTLVEAGAQALASIGLAGGLDPALSAGTLFLPERIVSAEGVPIDPSPDWRRRLIFELTGFNPVTTGSLLSRPQALMTIKDKAAAFRETGASAIDMESSAVARLAATHACPFVAVKVIVDTASDTLPRAVMNAGHFGQPQIGRLIGALVISPHDLAAVMRLARRYWTARRVLRAATRLGFLRQILV